MDHTNDRKPNAKPIGSKDAIPIGSEVRIHMKCIDITEKNPGQYLAKTEVTMEIKGVEKPAFAAETLSMFIV